MKSFNQSKDKLHYYNINFGIKVHTQVDKKTELEMFPNFSISMLKIYNIFILLIDCHYFPKFKYGLLWKLKPYEYHFLL